MIVVSPDRGIKQGNSITMYTFIVVLSILADIHFKVNVSKSGIGIKVSKNALIISYLKFVNDCMIFVKRTG